MRERPPHPSLRPVCALYRIRFMVCAIREGTAVGSAAAAAIPIAHVLWSRPHPKCRRHLAFRFLGGIFGVTTTIELHRSPCSFLTRASIAPFASLCLSSVVCVSRASLRLSPTFAPATRNLD